MGNTIKLHERRKINVFDQEYDVVPRTQSVYDKSKQIVAKFAAEQDELNFYQSMITLLLGEESAQDIFGRCEDNLDWLYAIHQGALAQFGKTKAELDKSMEKMAKQEMLDEIDEDIAVLEKATNKMGKALDVTQKAKTLKNNAK